MRISFRQSEERYSDSFRIFILKPVGKIFNEKFITPLNQAQILRENVLFDFILINS